MFKYLKPHAFIEANSDNKRTLLKAIENIWMKIFLKTLELLFANICKAVVVKSYLPKISINKYIKFSDKRT
jgi:hypothetical protein